MLLPHKKTPGDAPGVDYRVTGVAQATGSVEQIAYAGAHDVAIEVGRGLNVGRPARRSSASRRIASEKGKTKARFAKIVVQIFSPEAPVRREYPLQPPAHGPADTRFRERPRCPVGYCRVRATKNAGGSLRYGRGSFRLTIGQPAGSVDQHGRRGEHAETPAHRAEPIDLFRDGRGRNERVREANGGCR